MKKRKKAGPQRETVTIHFRGIPRALRDHYSALCRLESSSMVADFKKHMMKRLKSAEEKGR